MRSERNAACRLRGPASPSRRHGVHRADCLVGSVVANAFGSGRADRASLPARSSTSSLTSFTIAACQPPSLSPRDPVSARWSVTGGSGDGSASSTALAADVSARHLSFIETGRARPSAEMVLRLAEKLDVPLRDRNELLLAAGFAPAYGQRTLEEPGMGPVRDALDRPLGLLTASCALELLEEPVNVLRLALRPDGLAPRIANLGEWRAHRLGRQAVLSGDPALATLLEELACYRGLPPHAH